MTMIEVDPKLFIKCRLCLEDSGTYQIVPVVREQISYCFDINVEPFDGLPQLICKKCQSILCDYSKTKKYFIEKQDELRNRTQTNNLLQENHLKLKNLETAVKRVNTDPFENGNTKRRKVSVSSLTNNSENNEDPNNELLKRESSCETQNIKEDWQKTYHKTFACRFCSSFWYSSKAARYHKVNHRILKSKHADIFSKFCVVELPKIDSKPNLTGSLDQVVYSKTNIIAKGNLYYSIAYRFVDKNIAVTDGSDDEMKPDHSNVQENSDSSLRSNNVVRRKVRRRICSQSSDETVVLENQSNSRDSIENVCINIEDTDSDDEIATTRRTTRKVVKKNTVKVIKESAVVKLIASTQNKYLKKKGQPEKPPIELLNRKITSIGRQIINKRGFNCNRLMKYMEHLNLNIIWLPRSPLNITSNTNYYKIIPRSRYKNEKNIDDFEGYKKKYDKLKKSEEARIMITETRSLNEGVLESTGIEITPGSGSSGIEETPGLESLGIEQTPGFIGASDETELKALLEMPAIVSSSENQVHLPQREYSKTPFVGNLNIKDEIPESSYASELEGILLHSATTSNDTKKLLNANPVANPKKLKKFTSESKKDKAKSNKNMLTIEVAPIMPTLEVNPDELTSEATSGIENIMPVITFTRSLAVPDAGITEFNHKTPNNDSTNNGNPVNSNSERSIPTVPRIKVKSVAELMSKETLSRMREPSAAVVTQHQNGAGNIVHSQSQNPTTSQPSNVSLHEPHNDKYIILDTVEFPNTKTNLPFKYFKMLLQVHNISLLDTDASLTAEFHTLLRFKVQYNQNAITEPVVLCLSLFCANNVFCFKIKDRNDDNIDMTKVSALWQWEILKIYRGEVVSKILAYAKKISQQVYENTNRFMCLLKSIKFVSK